MKIQRVGPEVTRAQILAAAMAMMVSLWAPARAFAWIPQSIPVGDIGSSATDGGEPSWNLPMNGLDAELGSAVMSFQQPQSAFRSGHTDWVSMGNFAVAQNSSQMFGMNWMYWAGMAAVAGLTVMALSGHGSSGGSAGNTSGGGADASSPAQAPVPEPSSLWMFGVGALALLWGSRRRVWSQVSMRQTRLD